MINIGSIQSDYVHHSKFPLVLTICNIHAASQCLQSNNRGICRTSCTSEGLNNYDVLTLEIAFWFHCSEVHKTMNECYV